MFIAKLRNPVVFSLIFLALVVGQAVTVSAGPNKTIRDWWVYCTDSLVCKLSTAAQSEKIYGLEFERGSDANAPVGVLLSLQGQLDASGETVFSVDGQKILSVPNSAFEMHEGVWRYEGPGIIENIMPALKSGSGLNLAVQSDTGALSADFSLSGSAGAMLFVDEVQDRIGKVDALQAKGQGQATGRKTRAEELASVSALPATVSSVWSGGLYPCSEEDRDLIAEFGGTKIRITNAPAHDVYVLPCGGPGAYNMVYTAILHSPSDKHARQLLFPTMSEKGPSVTETAFNVGWDDINSQLSAYYKGRGLGDCGVSNLWEIIDMGSGPNFVLVEERAKDNCDGKDDEWPLVWPIQQ